MFDVISACNSCYCFVEGNSHGPRMVCIPVALHCSFTVLLCLHVTVLMWWASTLSGIALSWVFDVGGVEWCLRTVLLCYVVGTAMLMTKTQLSLQFTHPECTRTIKHFIVLCCIVGVLFYVLHVEFSTHKQLLCYCCVFALLIDMVSLVVLACPGHWSCWLFVSYTAGPFILLVLFLVPVGCTCLLKCGVCFLMFWSKKCEI